MVNKNFSRKREKFISLCKCLIPKGVKKYEISNPPRELKVLCPECGSKIIERIGRRGKFLWL